MDSIQPVQSMAAYLGLGRRRRPSLLLPGVDYADQTDQDQQPVQDQPAPPPEAQGPPGPDQARMRSWALDALQQEMNSPHPMPTRRPDQGLGAYSVNGQVYKPSTGQKIIGLIGSGLAGVAGGPGAAAAAQRESFDAPYAEAMGRFAGTEQLGRQRRQDLLKAAQEEVAMAREDREARLGRSRQGFYDARAGLYNKRTNAPPAVVPEDVGLDDGAGNVAPARVMRSGNRYLDMQGSDVTARVRPLPAVPEKSPVPRAFRTERGGIWWGKPGEQPPVGLRLGRRSLPRPPRMVVDQLGRLHWVRPGETPDFTVHVPKQK